MAGCGGGDVNIAMLCNAVNARPPLEERQVAQVREGWERLVAAKFASESGQAG